MGKFETVILLSLLWAILPHSMTRQLALPPAKATFGSKIRVEGICRYLKSRQCKLLSGGRICRKNTRLTRYCPFKVGFALKKDGTISTRLTDKAYKELIHYLRDIKLKELGHG